jgi:hypothetical protein
MTNFANNSLPSLVVLDLSSNNLINFTFSSDTLQNLDLESNSLTSFNFAFKSLQSLTLDNNYNLNTFVASSTTLPNIIALYLSSTSISDFSNYTISNLTTLAMNNNNQLTTFNNNFF